MAPAPEPMTVEVHPANVVECGRRGTNECASLYAAWMGLVRARRIPFSDEHPLLWLREFQREVRSALQALTMHREEAEGRSGLLHAGDAGGAAPDEIARQLAEHVEMEELLTALVRWTEAPEDAPQEQCSRCRDSAFTGQLLVALHHWRLVQILKTASPGRRRAW